MQYGLGIDLGTTQTAAAIRADGRVEVVRLGARRPEIPSLLFVKPDGGFLIGDAAERRGQAEPARLAREFKRRIGDPVPILVGGSPFSAHALTAKLLRHVLDSVTHLQDGPPAVVTVTHPANWGPYKREQLDQAIRLADAGQVLMRTEPEAAALQHATARRIGPGETVAVYDLGGGTFDAAVLRRDGGEFVLLGEPDGIEQLGGVDFDEAVFGHVVGLLGSQAQGWDPDDPEVVTALARLRRDCMEAKEALSSDTEVMIPVALPGLHTRVRLNRSELESMIAPSLEETVAAMHRALRSAGITAPEVSAVLLAGGSSRIPLVAQMLSTAFERPVVADPHPEHSFAMGAAVATSTVLDGGSPFAAAADPGPAGRTVSTALQDTLATTASAPAVAAVPVSPAGGQPVAFAPGTASVPQTTASTGAAPPGGAAPGLASAPGPTGSPAGPPPPGTTSPTGTGAPRGNGRKLVMVGAVVVAVIAAGTAAAVAMTGDEPGGGDAGGPAPAPASAPVSAPVSASAAPPAPPYPTDPILTRIDTGRLWPESTTSIAVFTPGATARTAIPGTAGHVLPQWSSDRTRIATTRIEDDGTCSVWVMNADGSDARRVVDDTGLARVAWSPDDTTLAYMAVVDKVPQIFTIRIGGSTPRQLTSSKTSKDDPAWSPDGKTIMYWANVNKVRHIYLLPVDEPREPGRRVTSGDEGPVNDPSWSPDGKTIAYTRVTGDGVSDIWLIGADGTNARALTDDPAKEMDPTWSPDGGWIGFVRGPLGQPKITIVKSDGSEEHTLTRGAAREGHPGWS